MPANTAGPSGAAKVSTCIATADRGKQGHVALLLNVGPDGAELSVLFIVQ
jgi:hypothetical protein